MRRGVYLLILELVVRPQVESAHWYRASVLFCWFDLWVGLFVDQPNNRLYLLPLPCLGFMVEWGRGDPPPE